MKRNVYSEIKNDMFNFDTYLYDICMWHCIDCEYNFSMTVDAQSRHVVTDVDMN